MEQVVAVQVEILDHLQRRLGTVELRDRDRTVERDDGRGRDREQQVVQREHLRPVGLLGSRRIAVHRVDRGLYLVRPGLVAPKAPPHEVLTLEDQLADPTSSGPDPEAARSFRPRQCAAGRTRLGQQQSEQAERLELVGHQLHEQSREPNRLRAQVGADELVAVRRGVALVEDQVDHREDRPKPVRELRIAREPVRILASRSWPWRARVAWPSSPPEQGTPPQCTASRARRGVGA